MRASERASHRVRRQPLFERGVFERVHPRAQTAGVPAKTVGAELAQVAVARAVHLVLHEPLRALTRVALVDAALVHPDLHIVAVDEAVELCRVVGQVDDILTKL